MDLCFQKKLEIFFKLLPSRLRSAVLFLMIISSSMTLSATDSKGKGLKEHTPEQLKHIEENSPWISSVKPNKIGRARLKEHLKKHGKKFHSDHEMAASHEEITSTKGLSTAILDKLNEEPKINSYPTSVNNSVLPSFPPIGDQGQLGSCVAWGSTYYQASHEIGLLNGINNKTSQQGILSPKWTYNILNGGHDGGLYPADAFKLLSSNGAISISNWPYDNNYLAWDTNAQDWVSAISNRLSPVQAVAGLGGSQPQNLDTIKQLLSNGHVLTFATFVESWVYTTVKNDPANPNSSHVGEQAVAWMNGTNGGHYLTIVGYDDNIWIDINNNGRVDSGEKGAFLIANSWGTSWGNQGFIWIAYDAFRGVSAVPNGPSKNRVALGEAMNSIAFSVVPVAANYRPSLVSNFSITQAARNQISVQSGISSPAVSSPTTTFTNFALMNKGGNFEFNGSYVGSPQTVTFALDMTPLLPTGNSAESLNRYYLTLQDNATGNPTQLNTFTLTDNIHQRTTSCTQVPLVCDGSGVKAYIDYNFVSVVSDINPPVVNITSPNNNEVINGTVNVTVNATDDVAVAKVELYVDSQLYSTDTTNPYFFILDTTQFSNGPHQLTAIAYDSANNQDQQSIEVNVENVQYPLATYVNSGGNAVMNNNINWQQDFGFTGTSTSVSSLLNFTNPIYETARTGSFSYKFPAANGKHLITLKFAELLYAKKGKRIFNVNINGISAISHLDLYKAAGLGYTYDKSFTINVTNNQIKIDFIPVVGEAIVNGIEIVESN